MRLAAAFLVLGLTACGPVVISDGDGEARTAAADGYVMEIRAGDNQQTYLITTPDGRTVGARAAEGASALMDDTRARALAAEPPPQGEDLPEQVSIRLPGFEMSVAGDETAHESGQVRISVGGEGGQRVTVNADEGGPGEADDLAFVRITGADADAVREFIAEQEELSAEVKSQLIAELQLPPASENAAQ